MDIIQMLKDEHKKLITIMDGIEAVGENQNEKYDNLFQSFKKIFRSHDDAEDKVFYPALRKHNKAVKLVLKSYQAHHMVEIGILELRLVPYNSESWLPKFEIVRDSILTHIKEEEEKLFPMAIELLSKAQLNELGVELENLRRG